jgi:hypothetical protein
MVQVESRQSGFFGAILLVMALFSGQACFAQSSPESAVFSVFSTGKIQIGTGNNAIENCQPLFFNSPQQNATVANFGSQGRCSNLTQQVSSKVAASGKNASKQTLPAFQGTTSTLDVAFVSMDQVWIKEGSATPNIFAANGQAQVSAGTIVKKGALLTLPGGDYSRIQAQNGTLLHLQAKAQGSSRIKTFNVYGCNNGTIEIEPGDYYIENLTWYGNCNLKVTGTTGAARLFVKNGFALNQPSCWNMADNTCGVAKGAAEVQAQQPDRLSIQIYQGDFSTQGGAQLSAGLYVDAGNITFNNGNNSSFVGEAIAKNITIPNNSATVYGYKATQFTPPSNQGPVITLPLPQNWVNTLKPAISAQIADTDGIDLGKTVLQIDGAVVSGVQTSNSAVNWASSVNLAEGKHIVKLTVFDGKGASSVKEWSFMLDASAPVATDLNPGVLTRLNPTISAKFSDTLSGIDDSKTQLLLDGVDITNSAVRSSGAISYSAQQVGGQHTVKLKFADLAGNSAEANWAYTVIANGPGVNNLTIQEGSKIAADVLPRLKADFVDNGAGIDLSKVSLLLDGQNINALANITATGFDYTPNQVLVEGTHTLSIFLIDNLGNTSLQTIHFVSASAPVISAQFPTGIVSGIAAPTISAIFSDIGSGIDPGKTVLWLDQIDVSPQATITATDIKYTPAVPLTIGKHKVKLQVLDKAGNVSVSEWEFNSIVPPTIGVLTPKDVILPAASRPTISATYQDANSPIDIASIRLIVNGQDVSAQSTITASNISYTPVTALAEGPYTVYLEVGNKAYGTAQAVWGFEVDTLSTYNISISSPVANAIVTQPRINVTASAIANKTYATSFTVNGKEMQAASAGSDGSALQYSASVDLVDGNNTLTVLANFADGQTRSTSTQVSYNAPPTISITSPLDKTTLGPVSVNSPRNLTGNVERPVTITGTTSKPVTSVTINQQAATLSAGGTEFRFDNFFLHEGVNLLSAVATSGVGQTASTSITVAVDQTAPILTIEAPVKDAVTSNASIDVRGIVNDAIEGWIAVPYPVVSVSNNANTANVTAKVSDRFYIAEDLPLEIGNNTLTITATDHVGNSRSQTVNITRIAAGSNRITLLSGNRQRGGINTQLPKALAIVALDKQGNPLANTAIQFDILRGTGSLNAASSGNSSTGTSTGTGTAALPDRNLVVNTDAAGRAQVWLTLGKQSGEAGNMVRASNPQMTEEVIFTATAEKGLPAYVRADAGVAQYGETNASALEALTAVVTDSEENRLPNASVVFTIEEGEAYFIDANGSKATSMSVTTDKNGLAAARPVFGSQPGLVRISALANNPANQTTVPGAYYQIQVLQQQDGPTQFSGKVLTHTGAPLPGVRVSIGRTSLNVTTDATGFFRFDDQVPPGKLDLFIDGRTADIKTSQYPALHFEALAVRGQNNVLPHPIYLPPLLMSQAKIVGGDQDVTLKIPGFEGFEMIVKANSVTFPDGSKQGPLVVSPVQQDKLPMVPPGGYSGFMAPAWTIQPSGTRFDPPIQVKIPNSINLKPGETREIYQWDHDLATFVAMGRATVSEDGALLISDANSGVTKAGWGGPPNPPPFPPPKCGKGSAPDCKDCQKSENDANGCPRCVVDSSKDKAKCQENACKWCQGGACQARPGYSESKPYSRLAINFLPLKGGPPITVWGTTFLLPVHADGVYFKFELDAYCDAKGSWRAVIKTADYQILQTNQIPPGVIPLGVGAIQNETSCSRLYVMKNSLINIAEQSEAQPQQYYVLAAVKAHEDVHVRQFKTDTFFAYTNFRIEVENLTVPIDLYPDANAAAEGIKNLTAYQRALQKFKDATRDAAAKTGLHDNGTYASFKAAEHGVIDPYVSRIESKLRELQCF